MVPVTVCGHRCGHIHAEDTWRISVRNLPITQRHLGATFLGEIGAARRGLVERGGFRRGIGFNRQFRAPEWALEGSNSTFRFIR
jgi:hypothetical protein